MLSPIAAPAYAAAQTGDTSLLEELFNLIFYGGPIVFLALLTLISCLLFNRDKVIVVISAALIIAIVVEFFVFMPQLLWYLYLFIAVVPASSLYISIKRIDKKSGLFAKIADSVPKTKLKAPTYNWSCPKCNASNIANTSICTACKVEL